jgi:hypothetical protein
MLVIVACWGLLVLALWASHSQPAVVVLGGIVAAICSAMFITLDLADEVDQVEWTRETRRQRSVRPTDPRVSSLRNTTHGSWWSGSSTIGDTLVELVDDRLFAHHHVDRATDPTAAARLLSPTLRSLVETPHRSSMSLRDLRNLLTEIEAL